MSPNFLRHVSVQGMILGRAELNWPLQYSAQHFSCSAGGAIFQGNWHPFLQAASEMVANPMCLAEAEQWRLSA